MPSYVYFAIRLALVSLMPGIMYWLVSDFETALSVFLVFLVVGQAVAAWTYRKDLLSALRKRR